MAHPSASDLEIEELDSDGHPITSFKFESTSRQLRRVSPQSSASSGATLLVRCLSPFLPAGYPSTVTPDYTPYQIYDSLQAFASTIAGLLASRAVFVGMGVGSEDASLVTTMLLYIAQETIGRVATILFAHRFSQSIEAEVKFYRFLADIVNDVAFILDCMSPGLPLLGRVLTLCISNACRAICGVAGGSSKAILSSHFAKVGNIGELNAKDGSQETVVSLMGMWVGGLLVSNVQGTVETWICLIPLLTFHLWANWKAVRSVRLNSLNMDRANILFRGILAGQTKSLNEVGNEEAILGRGSRHHLGRFRIGSGVDELLLCMNANVSDTVQRHADLFQLVKLFQEEEYLLWFDVRTGEGVVWLKELASGETQAKCFCHMARCLSTLTMSTEHTTQRKPKEQEVLGSKQSTESGVKRRSSSGKFDRTTPSSSSNEERDCTFQLLINTLEQNNKQWLKIRDQAEQAGWDLSLTNLVKGHGRRIRVGSPLEEKKDK
ncbi:uncharacterized protein Z518_05638 [Rhinocladiella mackenziei CBS 650.93]|uniref:Protein root UVB sensitive/RUS domain-containing protein n=1 Tax=Rhinocladiella mackenziei CBS 650.93 TaxID=1442369 RepID=A0A0D2H2V5_9EURO|nr:uncharacterized protein Z518_05638 [Rhinocladiella mackenziei CBS 650.93]KIX04768.1 hypothetical protein Z518_05638 [Rhinocladiella mackenziei CBS 650.93]